MVRREYYLLAVHLQNPLIQSQKPQSTRQDVLQHLSFGLSDLSRKINAEVHLVFTSRKIKDELKAKEPKPPIVNQQNVVYFFECDLCDADYVGFTSRYLHQRVEEHKRSVIGNHVREQNGNEPREIAKNFRVLRNCSSMFDCLIFEMFFIRDLKDVRANCFCASLLRTQIHMPRHATSCIERAR